MYLKRLDLQGFKSFPDKTTLDFSQGLTMIVGPNGSGKSNISDAIRWVLGEQSVKHLRGSKMEDVIFAGTQDRKALGFAEVSITIDNSDRRMEIDFAEITVTRRVFRSGESEYFINGAACRLKDIHEVFMDTGLGRDGYSVIGQGKIDEILSNKAEDRRQIFEEAAGISKYKYRKIEAERKLVGTEDNLTRLYDILSELEGRLEPLERQSETAKKYLVLREELKKLEVSLSVAQIAKCKQSLKEIEEAAQTAAQQLEQEKERQERLEREVSALYEGNSETEQKIGSLRENVSAEEGRIAQYMSEIAIYRESITQNTAALSRLKDEGEQFTQSIASLQEKKLEKKQELEQICNLTAKLQEELSELLQSYGHAEQQVRETEAVLKEKNEDLVEITAELGELKAALSHVDALEQTYQSRLTELAEQQERRSGEEQELEAAFTQNRQQGEESLARREALTRERETGAEKLSALQKQIEEQEQILLKQQATYRFKTDRVKMLTDMEREFEGYQKGAKSILQNQDGALRGVRIHGALSQLISVEGAYTVALETALGQALQNIVTETEEDAKQAISYLKKNKLGRVTFLPVSAVRGREFGFHPQDCPGFLGIASDLVQAEDRYQDILSSLLGATVVVDTMDHAIAMARKFQHKFRIVTLEGELCNVGGSMSGGFINRQAGILSRANDKKKLAAEAEIMKETIGKSEAQLAAWKQEAQLQRERQEKVSSQEQAETAVLIRLAEEEKHLQSRRETFRQSCRELSDSIQQIQTRMQEITEQTQQKRVRLAEITKGSAQMEQDAGAAQQAYEEAVSRRETLSQEMNRCRMETLDGEKNADICREQINSLESRLQFDQNERNRRLQQIEETGRKNEHLEKDILHNTEKIGAVNREIDQIRERIVQLEEGKQGDQTAISQKQEQARESRKQMLLLQQEYGRIESKKAKAEYEIDAIINRLWEDYGLTYTTAAEFQVELESLTKAQREISRLKKEISSLGHINIDAIEEFKQVKERFTFLSGQRDDLLEAKQSLEKVIREMQELMKTIFSQQFETINTHFVETFQQLFGGGDAKLYLSDPTNVLESGVEIEVQPPGKKLQNMMLLSGGEKAMCAIAILFAIIKTRPAPFCIFDEIEAALDDVNVFRFANYLRVFNDRTQFIVVTHRRGTMEAADRLYGVTMEKKGISRMIMLDMDELEEFQNKK